MITVTLALTVVVLGQTPKPVPAQALPARSEAYLEFLLGRRLEGNGDVEGAIAALRKAADLDSASAEIRAELAGLYARQDRVDEAIRWARSAIELDRDNREANRVMGLVYAAMTDQGQALGSGETSDTLAARAIEHLERANADPIVDPSLHYALGRLHLKRRDYDRAVRAFRRLLEEQPGVSEASLLLAEALQGLGQAGEARKALEEAIASRPDFVPARRRLADLHEQLGQWGSAADQYAWLAERSPGNEDLTRRRATALLRAGQPAAARDALAPLARRDRASPNDVYLLFQAERDLGALDAAEATARRLSALEPDGFRGAYALAQIFEQRGEHQLVIDTLAPVVARGRDGRLPPTQVTLLLSQIGFAHQALGQHQRALETFAEIRRLLPSDSTGAVFLVQAYIIAGRLEEAVQVAEEARPAFADDHRLVELEADALRRLGQIDRGVALARAALEARPSSSMAVTLSELLATGKQFEEAIDTLERALARSTGDVALVFQLGAVHERAGHEAAAEQAFRDVIARDPLHAPALNYLGYMFAEGGRNLDEAVELITRALRREPDNPSYLDSLGWAYFRLGRLDEAAVHLRRAAEALSANSVVQDHLGDVLFRLRRYDEAIAAWQRALDGDGDSIDREVIEAKIRDARRQDPPR